MSRMPQSAALSWGGLTLTPVRTGAFGDYFRGASIAAWFFLLQLSFWWMRDFYVGIEVRQSGFDKNIQYATFAAVVLTHLTLGVGVLIDLSLKYLRSPKGKLLGGFCLAMFLLAPLSLTPLKSASYSAGTLAAILVCHWVWQMDYRRFRRVAAVAAIAIFVFLVLVTLHLGINSGSVGGITRNKFGQAGLAASVLLFITGGRVKWLGLAAGMAAAAIVSSRGSIVALGAFALVYVTLKLGLGRGILAALMAVVASIALLAVPKVGDRIYSSLFQKVLKVDDQDRGFGSGFTGRSEHWRAGLANWAQRPAFGWGFRTRDLGIENSESAHSGYINLLQDTGLIGAALVLGAFGSDFVKRFRLIQRFKREAKHAPLAAQFEDSLELNYVVCSFLAAESLLWIYEPLYLNLGAITSILLLMMIGAPYFVQFGSRGRISATSSGRETWNSPEPAVAPW